MFRYLMTTALITTATLIASPVNYLLFRAEVGRDSLAAVSAGPVVAIASLWLFCIIAPLLSLFILGTNWRMGLIGFASNLFLLTLAILRRKRFVPRTSAA